jgi:hypothetical protein
MKIGSFPRNVQAVAAATALSGMAGSAAGAELGFYVGADAGPSSYGLTHAEAGQITTAVMESFGLEIVDATSESDRRTVGYGVVVGYQFSPNLAVEGTYLDFRQARYAASGTLTDGVDDYDLDFGIKLKSGGPAVALVGSWPFGEAFALDARAGAYFGRTKLTVMISDGTDSESASQSDGDTALLAGVGATLMIAPYVSLRVGYTLYKDALLGERDIRQLSVGLRYALGY